MNVAQTLLNLDARKCLNFRQKTPAFSANHLAGIDKAKHDNNLEQHKILNNLKKSNHKLKQMKLKADLGPLMPSGEEMDHGPQSRYFLGKSCRKISYLTKIIGKYLTQK